MAETNEATLLIKLKDAAIAPAKALGEQLKAVSQIGEHLTGKFTEINQAMELLKKGFEAVEEGIHFLIEVGEELLDKFEKFDAVAKVFELKDAEHGTENLEEMLAKMKDVGIATDDALQIAKLLGREFNPKMAQDLALVIEDVRGNLRLTSQETKGLAEEFVSLGARATVGARQVRSLDKAFGGKDIATEVSKATGRGIATINAELKKGTLPTEQLVRGLRQAQLDLAGTKNAGEAAQKAAATSVEDQIQRLKNIAGDFGEDFAKKLFGGADAGDTLHKLGDELASFLKSPEVQQFMTDLASGLKMVWHFAVDVVPPALEFLKSVLHATKTAFDWLTSGSEGSKAVLAALAGVGIGLAIVLVALAVPIGALLVGLFLLSIPILIVIAVFAVLALVIYEVYKHWDDLVAGIKSGAMYIGAALMKAWAFMADFVKSFYDAGANAIQGLIDGIKSMADKPAEAIKGIAESIEKTFKAALHISSPSVVMKEAGEDAAEGVSLGVKSRVPHVQGSAVDLAEAVPQGFAAGGAPGGAAGGPTSHGNDVHVELHVNFHGMDADKLVQGGIPAGLRDQVEKGVRLGLSRAQLQG